MSSTAERSGEVRHQALEPGAIRGVEILPPMRVEIEHRHELAGSIEDRHHHLGSGRDVAGDMSRKGVNVGDELAATFARRRAADAAGERNLEAAERPLIGADPEHPRCDDAVETREARAGHGAEYQASQGRHHRDRIVDPIEHRGCISTQGVVVGTYGGQFAHSKIVAITGVGWLAGFAGNGR